MIYLTGQYIVEEYARTRAACQQTLSLSGMSSYI